MDQLPASYCESEPRASNQFPLYDLYSARSEAQALKPSESQYHRRITWKVSTCKKNTRTNIVEVMLTTSVASTLHKISILLSKEKYYATT